MSASLEKFHLLRKSLTVKPPVAIKGEGSYVYFDNGDKVIDASGGAAVLSIGHGVKEIADAMAAQAMKICYVTQANFTNVAAEELATEIIGPEYEEMGYSKVMFVNSGSEANENAYKLARQHFFEKGETQRVNLICRDIAYHGNTMVGMTMSRSFTRKAPFEALLPYGKFHRVSTPHPNRLKNKGESDDEYLSRLLKQLDDKFQELGPDTVMAMFFEPIVGTSGGCAIPPKGYLKGVKQICEKYGALLIYDEVIVGSGRCGTSYFAWERLIDEGDTYKDIQPDIVTVGKSLSGGYAPLSALIVHEKIIHNLKSKGKAFTSSHTFQSHIVSCAAALAVQKYIKRNRLFENVARLGSYLERLLNEAVGDFKCVLDIRGLGFIWTVELVKDKDTMENYPLEYDFGTLAYACILKHGVSVYACRGSVDGDNGYGILVAPAFNADEALIADIVNGIKQGLKDAMEVANLDLSM